ncbi:thiol-dependent ubiquitin-specific protease [Aureococcus anophagefferens]|uniref:Thiol-dependent ubiquitin-specific protease n=1 Tax=Aureococcus anophagefferens TaxID=44056 RepID=A0ABR1FZP9_AURAN
MIPGLPNSGSQLSLGSIASFQSHLSQVSLSSTVKAERRKLATERLEETAIELRKWLRSATKSLKHELYEDAVRRFTRAIDLMRALYECEEGRSIAKRHTLTEPVTLLGRLYYRRARVWLRLDQPREAELDLDQAVALAPKAAQLYLLKGATQMRLRRYADASETLLKGIACAPSDANVRRQFDGCLHALREQGVAYHNMPHAPVGTIGPAQLHDPGATPNVLASSEGGKGALGIRALGAKLKTAPGSASHLKEGDSDSGDDRPRAPPAAAADEKNTGDALTDADVHVALNNAGAFLHLEDLIEPEIEFWKSNGLELAFEEVLEGVHQVLLDFKPVLRSIFLNGCHRYAAEDAKRHWEAEQAAAGHASAPTPPSEDASVASANRPGQQKGDSTSLQPALRRGSAGQAPEHESTAGDLSRPTSAARRRKVAEDDVSELRDDDGDAAAPPANTRGFGEMNDDGPDETDLEFFPRLAGGTAPDAIPYSRWSQEVVAETVALPGGAQVAGLSTLIAQRASMSGSQLLRLLREVRLTDHGINDDVALVAIGRTLGRAAARREMGEVPEDARFFPNRDIHGAPRDEPEKGTGGEPPKKGFRRMSAVSAHLEVSTTTETFPFSTETPGKLSVKARGMLAQRPAAAWADIMAPGQGLNAIRFPQFLEVFSRVAAARYSAKIPQYLKDMEERQKGIHLDWIRAQAEFGRHRKELEMVGATHDDTIMAGGDDDDASESDGEAPDDASTSTRGSQGSKMSAKSRPGLSRQGSKLGAAARKSAVAGKPPPPGRRNTAHRGRAPSRGSLLDGPPKFGRGTQQFKGGAPKKAPKRRMSVVADDDEDFERSGSDDDESSRRPPSSRGGGGASDDSDSSASSGSDASSVGSVASVSSRVSSRSGRGRAPQSRPGSATAKRKGSFMGGGGPRAGGAKGTFRGRQSSFSAAKGAPRGRGSRTGASPSPGRGRSQSRGESGESDDGQPKRRAFSRAGSRQNLSRQGSRQNIGSVTGNTNVLIHRIGDGPPEAVVEKMTLVEVRSKMKIALLCDRIQYAVERHVVLQPEAVQGATHLRERADCEEFVERYRYRLWLRRVFAHYARAAAADAEAAAAAPTRPTTGLGAVRESRAQQQNWESPRPPVLDVREFVFMMKDLGLVSRTLTLSDVARTLVSVCSFTGEPKLDKLDQDDFARALFYCAEAKTFDGLVAAKDRVERFITHDFFLAIKTQTTVQMLWDQCDALAGFH